MNRKSFIAVGIVLIALSSACTSEAHKVNSQEKPDVFRTYVEKNLIKFDCPETTPPKISLDSKIPEEKDLNQRNEQAMQLNVGCKDGGNSWWDVDTGSEWAMLFLDQTQQTVIVRRGQPWIKNEPGADALTCETRGECTQKFGLGVATLIGMNRPASWKEKAY
jgi:hypothetical protein